MVAAGAYLRVLREARYSSREAIAKVLQVDDSQIERIEKGKHNTRGPFLFAFIREVRANANHITQLILDDSLDEKAAQQMAADWLKQIGDREPSEQEDMRLRAIALIDELLSDPQKLDRLMGYGERLQEE